MHSSEGKIEGVVCPACGGLGGRLLFAVTPEEAAQHFVLEQADSERYGHLVQHIRRLWGNLDARIVRCCDCGLGYVHPYVGGDAEFYGLAYQRTHYPCDKWEFERTVEALKPRIAATDDFRLMEIGAGDGGFLRLVTPELLSPSSILCTEFSDYGCGRLRQLGVSCLQRDIRDLSPDEMGSCFHAICLFQVFEHLDQNLKLLKLFSRLTTDDGEVFISVPNPLWTQFIERRGALLDMPPNHVARWGPAQLSRLADQTDWELIDHSIEPSRWLAQARKFAVFLYLRRSQRPRSLANRIEAGTRFMKRARQGAAVGWYTLSAMRAMVELRDPCLGNSLWMRLRKRR